MEQRITSEEQIKAGIANEMKIDPSRIHVTREDDANLQTLVVEIDERTEDERLTSAEIDEISGVIEDMGWSVFAADPNAEEGESWIIEAEHDTSIDADERIWLDETDHKAGWVTSETDTIIKSEQDGRQIGWFDEQDHAHYEGFVQDDER